MRRIRDNAYIISMGRGDECCSRIIAARANMEHVEGRRLFEMYAVPAEARSFLKNHMQDTAYHIFALPCDAGQKVLLFFTQFYFGSGLLLVVEPRFSANMILRILRTDAFGEVLLFPDWKNENDAIPEDYPAELLAGHDRAHAVEREAFYYLRDILQDLRVLYYDLWENESFSEHLQNALAAAASFAGVEGVYQYAEDDEELLRKIRRRQQQTMIFDPYSCDLLLLTVAMLARKYSWNRKIILRVLYQEQALLLQAGFARKGRSRAWDACERLFSKTLSVTPRIKFFCQKTSNAFTAELFPFYADEGALALKQRPLRFWYRLPEEAKRTAEQGEKE